MSAVSSNRLIKNPVSKCALCGRIKKGILDEWREDQWNSEARRLEGLRQCFNITCCADCWRVYGPNEAFEAQLRERLVIEELLQKGYELAMIDVDLSKI